MLTDPNQRATTVKNQDITKISGVCKKGKKNSLKILKIILETKPVAPITLFQTTTQTITTTTITKTVTELKESHKRFIHLVRLVGKQTTPQRNATMEPMKPTRLFFLLNAVKAAIFPVQRR